MPSGDYLIWIDLEMTGLKPDSDSIIEIATVLTDRELNVVADGPVLAIHQPDEVLARMDDWNQRQHGSSGLLARVRASPSASPRRSSARSNSSRRWSLPAARPCAATASARTAASSRA